MKYLSVLLMFFIISCDFEEGEGGEAKIRGYVYLIEYNSEFDRILDEYYVPKWDVYISYGADTSTFHDKVETHYDGSFEFRNLRKGDYIVYTYSKDSSKFSGEPHIPVIRKVKITSEEQEILVEEMVVID